MIRWQSDEIRLVTLRPLTASERVVHSIKNLFYCIKYGELSVLP